MNELTSNRNKEGQLLKNEINILLFEESEALLFWIKSQFCLYSQFINTNDTGSVSFFW